MEKIQKHVGKWKFLEAYDPKMLLSEEKTEITLEEKQLFAAAFQSPDETEIIIAFRGTDTDNGEFDNGNLKILGLIDTGVDKDFILEHLVTNVKIGVAKPGRQFELAMWFYRRIKKRYDSKISFTGHSLGGGLAQYAAVMSSIEAKHEGPVLSTPNDPDLYIENLKKTVTWNAIGVKSFSEIMGYEFLDDEIALFHRLKDKFGKEIAKEKYEASIDKLMEYFQELGYGYDKLFSSTYW